jgi:hypothetical protein
MAAVESPGLGRPQSNRENKTRKTCLVSNKIKRNKQGKQNILTFTLIVDSERAGI